MYEILIKNESFYFPMPYKGLLDMKNLMFFIPPPQVW